MCLKVNHITGKYLFGIFASWTLFIYVHAQMLENEMKSDYPAKIQASLMNFSKKERFKIP